MYARDVFEYSQQELDRAWGSWRASNRRAPAPSDIIGMINPPYTIDEVTDIVVDAIMIALNHSGWNGDHENYVFEWFGPSWSADVARDAVTSSGGWRKLWLTAGKEKATFFKKDLKEMVKVRVSSVARENPERYLKRQRPTQQLEMLKNKAPGRSNE